MRPSAITLVALLSLTACDAPRESDTSSDAPAESDTSSDAETDTDSESDAESDTSTDAGTDAESDTSTDAETDTDAESDTSTDAETDTDVESDAGTTDTSVESDTFTDAETDTDAESDTSTGDGDAGGGLEDEPSGPDWGPSIPAISSIEGPGDAIAFEVVPSVGPTPFSLDDVDPSRRIPLTRLFAMWNPEATVDEVNAVLASYDLEIGMAHPDLRSLTLITPRFADRAAGDALALEIQATGVFRWVSPTKELRTYAAPAPIVHPTTVATAGNLGQTRTFGAWHAASVAALSPRRTLVLVADAFLDNTPDARIPSMAFTGPFVPELRVNATTGNREGNHGFFVANLVASDPRDAELTVTGGVFDPASEVDVQGFSITGLTEADFIKQIGDHAPRRGHWVLNASFGYRDLPSSGGVTEIERFALARDWRLLMRTMPDVLVVAAVSNFGANAEDRGAAYDSFFNSQGLIGDLFTLIPADLADLFAPDWIADLEARPFLASVQGNTISVGAADSTGQRATFSSEGAQLLAPGIGIRSGCRFIDNPLPGANAECVGPNLDGTVIGTSFATPQVSSAAAWLMSLAPELPVSTIRSILLETARGEVLDVYAATLALERFGDHPVRAAMADFDRDGAFDEDDLAAALQTYRTEADERPNGAQDPFGRDHSVFDLNGDGYSRSDSSTDLDLDANGAITTAEYFVDNGVELVPVVLDESRITDLGMLCWLAYSGYYAGNALARDLLLDGTCVNRFARVGPRYEGTISYTVDSITQGDLLEQGSIVRGSGFVWDGGLLTRQRQIDLTYTVICDSGLLTCRVLDVAGSCSRVEETVEPAYSQHAPPLVPDTCYYEMEWSAAGSFSCRSDAASTARALTTTFVIDGRTLRANVQGLIYDGGCDLTGTAFAGTDPDLVMCGTDSASSCGGPGGSESKLFVTTITRPIGTDPFVGSATVDGTDQLQWNLSWVED